MHSMVSSRMKLLLLWCIASMTTTQHVANGMQNYLQTNIPNGDKWKGVEGMFLGHKDSDKNLRTFLSKAFAANKFGYNEVLCKTVYEGAGMTVGEAFGDPCCTWKQVGDPLEPITPWAAGSLPTVKTVCPTGSTTATSSTEGTVAGGTTGGGTAGGTKESSTDAAIEIKTVKMVAAEDSSVPGTKGKSGRKAAKLDDDEEDVVVFFKSKKKRLHCRVKKSD